MENIKQSYEELYSKYGPQGWWPILGCKGTNPTKSGSIQGYHPEDYSYPHDEKQKFEICLGAILTQNTAWPNVEKALLNLDRIRSLSVSGIKKLSDGKLREMIKPAGYYNQKSRYIREFIVFFGSLDGRTPKREELLDVKGVGPETADSILLYAYKVTTFVVDTYTRRMLVRLRKIGGKESYDQIKMMFENNLPTDWKLYQEFHALIVEDAKHHSKR